VNEVRPGESTRDVLIVDSGEPHRPKAHLRAHSAIKWLEATTSTRPDAVPTDVGRRCIAVGCGETGQVCSMTKRFPSVPRRSAAAL
jgi:hypothetical protein